LGFIRILNQTLSYYNSDYNNYLTIPATAQYYFCTAVALPNPQTNRLNVEFQSAT